jgi:predicted HicB family RNase H-like nuclease
MKSGPRYNKLLKIRVNEQMLNDTVKVAASQHVSASHVVRELIRKHLKKAA